MANYYGGDLFITGGVDNFLGMLAISSDDENSVMSDGSYSSSSVSSSNESSSDRSSHSTTSLEAKNRPVVVDEDNDLAAEFSSSDDDITGEKDGGWHSELVGVDGDPDTSDNAYVRHRHGVNKHEIKTNTWLAKFTGGIPKHKKSQPNLIDVDNDSLKEPAADHLYEKTLEPMEPVSVFGEIPADDVPETPETPETPELNKLFGEPPNEETSPKDKPNEETSPKDNSNDEHNDKPNEVFGDLIDEIVAEPSMPDPKLALEKKKISTILDHHGARRDNVKDPDAESTTSSSSDDAIGGDDNAFGGALKNYVSRIKLY